MAPFGCTADETFGSARAAAAAECYARDDKLAVTAAVRARGFKPADDNEADAIAILLWAIETHGGVR